jgi:hypothetical protein
MRGELHAQIATWLVGHVDVEQFSPSIAFHYEHGKKKSKKKISKKKKKKITNRQKEKKIKNKQT